MTRTTPLSADLVDLDEVYVPIGAMRQLSRVTRLEGAAVAGEVDIGPDHPIFQQHFPGDPIFPGTLMIEAAGQLVAVWAWSQTPEGRPRLIRTSAKFHDPVLPDDLAIELRTEVTRRRNLFFAEVEVTRGKRAVASVDIVLAVID